MDIAQLKSFLAVCQYRQITRAAEQLFLTQSALSKQMRQMEQEVGLPLLARKGKELFLTTAGMEFADYARSAVAQHEKMAARLRRYADAAGSELALGIAPGLDAYGIPRLLAGFSRECPRCRLHLIEREGAALLQMLDAQAIELAVLDATALPPEQYVTVPLATDRLALACPVRHPLAAADGALSLKALKGASFLALEWGKYAHAGLYAAFRRAGFQPRVRQRFHHAATLAAFLREGDAVALLPARALPPTGRDGLVLRPLKEELPLTFALAFPHGRRLSPAAHRLKEYAKGVAPRP